MSPRLNKLIAAVAGAVAAITMMGVGSAAAQTPQPKPGMVAEAADKGSDNRPQSGNGPSKLSFKPRR